MQHFKKISHLYLLIVFSYPCFISSFHITEEYSIKSKHQIVLVVLLLLGIYFLVSPLSPLSLVTGLWNVCASTFLSPLWISRRLVIESEDLRRTAYGSCYVLPKHFPVVPVTKPRPLPVFIIRKTKAAEEDFRHLCSRLTLKSNGIELIIKGVEAISFTPDSCHVGQRE